MATAKQIKNFIETVAPIIQKYASKYGYKVASPIIAQACLESAYGTSSLASKYHNYFGMKCGSAWKGKSVNLSTKEEYTVGQLTSIKANFRVYDSLEEGIEGYFIFISAKRYANLKSAKIPAEYLELIKADGYATSSTYVQNNLKVIDKYNLTQYDTIQAAQEPEEGTKIRYAVVYECCYLNCREKAVNGTVRGIFAKGTKLMLQSNNGEWWKVSGKDIKGQSITGYCYSKYLREV